MDYLLAIVLGIVQGLTEFLPVSSSGHLELAKFILGDDSMAEESMLMSVTLHGATALSTMVVFRKEILQLVRKLIKLKWNDGTQYIGYIVLSMIPAVLVGLFFEDVIESLFDKQILLVASMLIFTGLLLWFADNEVGGHKTVGVRESIIIGLAQAVAIIPGISRSGSTIACSILLGIEREKAARFSFLMVLPLIFGKIIKDVLDGSFATSEVNLGELGLGFVCAFIAGVVACQWMISLVKNTQLKYFAWYCFVVGSAFILFKLMS